MQVIKTERVQNTWRLWISHNADVTEGTFFELHDNGALSRITIHPDGGTSQFIIREE